MMAVGGYYGPGSYYYPVILQLIFVFPVVYFLIRENPKKGLIWSLLFNILYELAQRVFFLGEETYRLLLFRYIFLIAFGCYLYREGRICIRQLVISFMVGVVFITVVCYTAYKPHIIIYWTNTSFMAGFYIIPIFYCLISMGQRKIKCGFLEICGKASYNIFLVQMVYYCTYLPQFVEENIGKIGVLFNLIICLAGGIGFYFIETPITGWVVKKMTPMLMKLDKIICE